MLFFFFKCSRRSFFLIQCPYLLHVGHIYFHSRKGKPFWEFCFSKLNIWTHNSPIRHVSSLLPPAKLYKAFKGIRDSQSLIWEFLMCMIHCAMKFFILESFYEKRVTRTASSQEHSKSFVISWRIKLEEEASCLIFETIDASRPDSVLGV